nr:methyltransferase domain-containing protein [Methanosarcina horonobensis]
MTEKEGLANVSFQVANIFDLPFEDETFDHVFICFVLEHLKNPLDALLSVKKSTQKRGHDNCYRGRSWLKLFLPRER